MKNDSDDDLFAWQPPAPATPQQHLTHLRTEVQRHMDLYYGNAQPEISDAEFDQLYRELETLEAAHPELADDSSPSHRPGHARTIDAFIQRPHVQPMLSIDDVFEKKSENPQQPLPPELRHAELITFYQRLEKLVSTTSPAVTVEPKIDGVAVSLVYEKGKLAYAITRGDGLKGDDITHNVLTIQSIPRTLNISPEKIPERLEIRGEIFMPNTEFLAMNEQRDAEGLTIFANPRNATAGTLKQLDSDVAATRPLQFLAHSLGDHQGISFTHEFAFHQFLQNANIPHNQPLHLAKSLEELLLHVEQLNHDRHALGYATDGAVVKLLDYKTRQNLGTTARAPRWACAYKFLPEQQETRVKDITIQVGRTGVLTPVAELEPVPISGTIVSRATLHNQDEISRKDVRIGDLVVVEKAGEIIPAIVSVQLHARPSNAQPYSIENAVGGVCPSCQTPITREQVAWRCPSLSCPAQTATSLSHFASRKALDIEGLGKTLADALVREFSIQSPLEVFSLEENALANLNLGTPEQPRRFGEKNANKVVLALEAAKQKPLHLWIYALGIPQIGESAAKEISRLHHNFLALTTSEILPSIIARTSLENTRKTANAAKKQSSNETEKNQLTQTIDALKEKITQLDSYLAPFSISGDLGPVAAQNWLNFQKSAYGVAIIEKILAFNPTSQHFAKPGPPGAFLGKTFVITGTLSKERQHFQSLIEQHGGKVSSSLSAKTHFLLAGENAGSKFDKAKLLNVPILNEPKFLTMLPNKI